MFGDELHPYYHNEGLFTDYYLRHVLDHSPDFLDESRYVDIANKIDGIWRAERNHVASLSEAQLEERFIRPVLAALGFEWVVQPPVADRRPDYALFEGPADREAAQREPDGSRAWWSRAVAVADAKPWGRRLDQGMAGARGWTTANPAFQIYHYLAQTGCRWGILTNGRQWRLHPGAPNPDMQNHFEIDLPALLEPENGDTTAIRWFVRFFGRPAFEREGDGRCFLDRVRTESERVAAGLRGNVRERVYEALLKACRGFADHVPNDLGDGDLREIHDNALVLLYRLLFALYAESANLLPVRANAAYRRHYSMRALIGEIEPNPPEVWADCAVTLWPRLATLAATIDAGSAHMGVPAYNGGLFDPERYPFLAEKCLSDACVARIVTLLSQSEDGKRLDFRDLGVRHLGSIYEGLLEYRLARAACDMVARREGKREVWYPDDGTAPREAERVAAGDLYLVTDRGDRKTTGSYYTPEPIVEEIVEGAIGPLVDARLEEEQVLSLRVVDPAMGSGHFLVEATNYLARRLAERSAVDEERVRDAGAEEADLARYRRLVVERCIFGVDLNPLAVELAKLSLWLATVTKGQALSFLDHHLRCGNSLVGAELSRLASAPAAVKRSRRASEPERVLFDDEDLNARTAELSARGSELGAQPSVTRADVHEKAALLDRIEREHRLPYREMADLWCSQFYGNAFGTAEYGALVAWLQGKERQRPDAAFAKLEVSRDIARRRRFFHWELEFAEAFFDSRGVRRSDAGFDAVVGNPPWERVKVQENEFFSQRDADVALAATQAARKRRIAALEAECPDLWAEYRDALEGASAELAWVRESDLYPLTGTGDTNLYAVMAERAWALTAPGGRLGMVTPSGIATDKTTSPFFRSLVDSRSLHTLLDLENRDGAFAEVHRSLKYTVWIAVRDDPRDDFECAFFLRSHELRGDAPAERSRMGAADLALVNPNTRTCPVFRAPRDADLTRAIYLRVPVLARHAPEGTVAPWGVVYRRMLDMTNDSRLFRTARELEAEGCYRVAPNCWKRGEELYLPLYEGKMVGMYDHRAASVSVNPENVHRQTSPSPTTDEQRADPSFHPTPLHWVDAREVDARLGCWERQWLLAFKDVTAPTNERTMIAAILPLVAAGNSLAILEASAGAVEHCLLLACLNSLPLDWIARQKVGGQHLNWFIVEQLPVLAPEAYERTFGGVRAAELVAARVLELTYTAHDLAGFARDTGHLDQQGAVLPPFTWDAERRLHLRCQLDALYLHLYGIGRSDAEWILDSFGALSRREQRASGRYRTRELVLDYWSAYEAGDVAAWIER